MAKQKIVPSKKVINAFSKFERDLQNILDKARNGLKIPRKYDWMNIGTISEYNNIIKLFKANKYDRVLDLVDDLDTSAREEIPIIIYNWVEEASTIYMANISQ